MKQKYFFLFLSLLLSMNISLFADIFPVEFGTKYGYIDEDLNVRQMPIYDSATQFVDGVAVVKKDGLFYIINEDFTIIATILALWAGEPNSNRIYFANENDIFFTDYSGNYVIGEFDSASDFHEGYAVIEKKGKIYLLNENNELNSEFNKYIKCGYCGEGLYSVQYSDLSYGIVDVNGQVIIQAHYNRALSYAGDFFAFYTGNKRQYEYTGFIDRNDQVVIPAIYTDSWVIKDLGFLLQSGEVGKKGTWKLTDFKGKTLYVYPKEICIENTDNNILIYSEKVQKGRLYGFMMISGEKITEPIFNRCYSFRNGYAQAVYNNANVLVSKDGNIIYLNEIFNIEESVQSGAWG